MRAIEALSQKLQHFHAPDVSCLWHGIDETSRSLMVQALIARRKGQDVLYICDSDRTLRNRAQELKQVISSHRLTILPNNELIAFEVLAQSDELAIQRTGILNLLSQDHEPMVILTTGEALLQSFLPKETYLAQRQNFKVGQIADFEELRNYLVESGYRMERTVYSPGQAAVRGGIADVFVPGTDHPVRIEFFDDEVDSIRLFDEKTQRSLDAIESISLWPAREYFIPFDRREEASERLLAEAEKDIKAFKNKANGGAIRELAEKVAEDIYTSGNEDMIQAYAPYYGFGLGSFLDYMGEAQIFIDDLNRLEDKLQEGLESRKAHFKTLVQAGQVLPRQWNSYMSPELLGRRLGDLPTQAFVLLRKASQYFKAQEYSTYAAEGIPADMNNFQAILDLLRYWSREGYALLAVSPDAKREEQFKDLLANYGLDQVFLQNEREGGLRFFREAASPGAIFHRDRTVFLSVADIIGTVRPSRSRQTKEEGAETLSGPEDLEAGDYVVHTHHGIGVYKGTRHVKTGDLERDYLFVQYAGTDKLYVPMDQFNLLQRYRRDDGKKPKLNKLSGTDWHRTKSRVRSSVKKLAENLLEIQARRQSEPGFAFSPDSGLMAEFEAAFPFVETPDQLKAIEDVKADMEKPVPMDRLICGDVGYGKTEVAIRAAFKAVLDGKQVAVLVPTTILAQQHLQSFQERMEPYGAEVVALSRFTSAKEEKEILKGLREGTIDVVIGTHKLLNNKIVLRDLGLLIIDEEQRFGVSHKERIKDIRAQVDVLTLTATPIPRTLHMSLVGIRDMSLIDTPPEDRYPIQTYVVENRSIVLEQAIRKELARKGQIFIVYNRIQDMDRVHAFYQELIPDARIVIAHGRMGEAELERVILSFMEGEADILLSTTIIETGVDMPNVNTMIVHQADRFGLAQLYQLRGRIGRSDRVAYAYLTYEPQQSMTDVAEKRLQTLKSYTALGSGYQIAMKDLEFRGAGSLLGAEQHGNLMDVGFDIYMHMLQEAVDDLQGRAPEKTKEKPELDFKVRAYIPEETISDQVLRLQIYQKLDACKNIEELRELTDEFIDRFGDLPAPAWNLFLMMEIRILAAQIGVRSLKQEGDRMILSFREDAQIDLAVLKILMKEFPKRMTLSNRSGELKVHWGIDPKAEDNSSLDSMKVFLDRLWRLARRS